MARQNCARCGGEVDQSELLFSSAGEVCGTCYQKDVQRFLVRHTGESKFSIGGEPERRFSQAKMRAIHLVSGLPGAGVLNVIARRVRTSAAPQVR